MTVTNPPMPPAFTNDDFAARMNRVVSAAVERPCGSDRYARSGFGLAHWASSDGDH
jgi:hypothetical protein